MGLKARDVEDPTLVFIFIYHLSFNLSHLHRFVTPYCTLSLICYSHLYLDFLDYQ